MSFPKEHWTQIHSTNPLERLNGEIKRRTDVVAVLPNEAATVRLVGALLPEQNDEWAVQRRYMRPETLKGLSEDPRPTQAHRSGLSHGLGRRRVSAHDRRSFTPPLGTRSAGAGAGASPLPGISGAGDMDAIR